MIMLVQTLARVVEDSDFEIGWGALYQLHCFTYLLIKKSRKPRINLLLEKYR
jgi:hypothetical protein